MILKRLLGLTSEQQTAFAQNPLYYRSLLAWLSGIDHFGFSRPQPTIPPIAVVWNFTNACNLKCTHCYSDSNTKQNSKELNTHDALLVVDYLAKLGCASLSFSGGEPILREDFLTVAKRTADSGLLCTLSTNGTMIDHATAEDIASAGVSGVAISIDSISSAFHDEFRGVKGAHKQALRGLEACVEIDKFKEIILAYTLTNQTIDDIPQLIDLATEIGVTRFYVSKILPVGRGKNLNHLDVSKPVLKHLLKDLAQRFVHNAKSGQGIATLTRGMTYFAPQCAILSNYEFFPISEIVVGTEKRHTELLGESAVKLFRNFAEYLGGCATGLTYCGLSPEGDILPCAPATGTNLGNIMKEGLIDPWINNSTLKNIRLRHKIDGKCGDCFDKYICGGCRVTAFGETGNWLASDPSCPY
jgi:radical SAM protein with 4Fe4S-binding SPASM domain